MMRVEINGEMHEVADDIKLSELVASLSLAPERIAIELNREVAPRSTWTERRLAAGDKIEIVHFVGGG